MDGFLIIDKQVGVTSHDIVAMVRRAVGQKKVGHTGTLDPFATGVLPVALGEGTKAIQFLDESVKEYRAVMRLGVSTDTQDRTGTVLRERDWSGIAAEDLERLVPRFTGPISQLPPMYSALKRDGVALYTLARKGIEVEREPRLVEIYSLSFDWIRLPEAAFTVRCSRGTYVRTLAADMGEVLGCGAHLTELRRSRSGLFEESRAISIDELRSCAAPQDLLVPVDRALDHLRELPLTPTGGRKVCNGVVPSGNELLDGGALPAPDEMVRLTLEGRLLAVAGHHEAKGMRLARVFN